MSEDCCFVIPPNYEVVGKKVIREEKSFFEAIFYIKGTHLELSRFGRALAVKGYTGPETKLEVSIGPSEYFYG